MEATILKSKEMSDYEILIRRRGEHDYASYCPQLNHMIIGTEHEEVVKLMKAFIEEHIDKLD
jgi:hypothetical protein